MGICTHSEATMIPSLQATEEHAGIVLHDVSMTAPSWSLITTPILASLESSRKAASTLSFVHPSSGHDHLARVRCTSCDTRACRFSFHREHTGFFPSPWDHVLGHDESAIERPN